jgi:non-ribosomal peptide synthetase component F
MEDILLGTPVSGRGEIETENLIGRFVNTLALRCNLSGDPTGHEVVGRIRETVLNALEHQDVPFEKVVEAVHPDRELGRTPLFDVMFNLENVPHRLASSPGLTVEPYALDVFAVGTDLVAEIRNEADGALTCEFAYRTNLFDRETIQRALEHYKMLLRGIAGDVNRPISGIPMLRVSERNRLLVEWNDTKRAYPENQCIHELFEDQVRQSPDAPAVTFGDETLTYRELNQRANQLAHRLRRIGVGPDILVGLCVERSNEMLVGILAILKAGGAYVPLDPALPLERLQFMSTDADLRLILTQARLIPKLSSLPTELLCIDNAQATTDKVDLENPSPIASPDNLAYIIYTSGSTGSPKGVLIDHRGVVSYFSCFSSVFGLRNDDVVLQLASFAFDIL